MRARVTRTTRSTRSTRSTRFTAGFAAGLGGALAVGALWASSAAAQGPEPTPAPMATVIPVAEGAAVTARPTAVAATEAARVSFARFTLRSDRTLDLRGVEPSLYRGTFFHPRVERVRLCIVERESEGFYDVRSHDGYYGAYQMSPELAKGATWMMLPEAKRLLGPDRARELMERLRETKANDWPRYWQDAAFFTIYNWEGVASGSAHWAGGRWHCPAPTRT